MESSNKHMAWIQGNSPHHRQHCLMWNPFRS